MVGDSPADTADFVLGALGVSNGRTISLPLARGDAKLQGRLTLEGANLTARLRGD